MNSPKNHEETLFEAALQVPPEQRPAHLKAVCGGDAALRQRVELLLKSHEQATADFLTKPRALDPHKSVVPASPVPSKELLGTMIGKYKLLEKVGEGGFGVVYVAEQREPVKRRVALKIIKLGMDTKQVVARFEVERQALAMMDHPNIAKVFDAGATETGRPYFVMELVRGIRITDYCDQNNLPTRERLELFAKVCQAIQHAHQKGIIHRDIKPSNILVTLHDGVPVPKVIDFGIAKATQGELTGHTVYTQLQQFVGTPAYMSPEQAEMSGLDIATRSDIYALGVLLYELLTGRTPFDAKDLMASGIDAMRKTIREKEPLRPSTRLTQDLVAADVRRRTSGVVKESASSRRRLQELVHQLKGDLDWIVMKCLEKDRARRYETANGVATDLQRHLSHEPISARPPSAPYRFHKLVRRNKFAFTAGSAVVLALLIGLGGVLWQWRRAERHARGESQLRVQTQAQAEKTRLNLYAAEISVASQAMTRGDFGLARRTLAALRPEPGETDLRGFEWRYLWHRCQGEQVATLKGHEWIVTCVAFSPDGKLLASGSQDRTVKVWDAGSLDLVTTLSATTGSVWSVAFSPDAQRLVTCGVGGARVWNTRTWQQTGGFAGRIAAVAPTGSVMAVSQAGPLDWRDRGGSVSLWDYRSGEKLRSFAGSGQALAFSPDGKRLAVAVNAAGIEIREVSSGELLRSLSTGYAVWSVAFSRDGTQLAATSGSREPAIWNLAEDQPPRRLTGHFLSVWSADFSPDGSTIATTGSDQTIRLWDTATLESKEILRGHDSEVWCAAFSPDGKRLATGGKDQKVMLWSAEPRDRRDRLPGRAEPPPAFSPDGERIVMAGAGKAGSPSALWRARDGAMIKEVPGRPALGFSPDGNQVIHWSEDGTALELWSPKDLTTTRVALEGIKRKEGRLRYQGFSRESALFYAIDEAGLVLFWETASGKAAGLFQGPPPRIGAAALGPGGRHFALGAEKERIVRLYERITSREMQLTGHLDSINGVAFSPDGATLASSSLDGTIRLWDTASGKHLASLPAGLEGASEVAFSPDGRTLASVNLKNSIKLWHLATHRELASLDVPEAGDCLLFSPDGRRLAVTMGGNFLRLFDAPTLEELDHPPSVRENPEIARIPQ